MEEDELVDGDFYLLARSYFDCREYKRAAHVLRDQIGRKSLFLRFYALYLVSFDFFSCALFRFLFMLIRGVLFVQFQNALEIFYFLWM
jgi:hypothetical protein